MYDTHHAPRDGPGQRPGALIRSGAAAADASPGDTDSTVPFTPWRPYSMLEGSAERLLSFYEQAVAIAKDKGELQDALRAVFHALKRRF